MTKVVESASSVWEAEATLNKYFGTDFELDTYCNLYGKCDPKVWWHVAKNLRFSTTHDYSL